MIAEYCRKKAGTQTTYEHAKAVSEYITNPVNTKRQNEKCTTVAVFGVSQASAAAKEMCATAQAFYPEGGKVKDPLAHWSLSFQESLTDEQLISLAKEFCEKMRVPTDKHQALFGVHRDTKHGHVHILVNKVSMDGEYSTMGFSNDDRLYKLHSQKVIAEMSHKYGFAQLEKNRFEIGPDGKAIKKPQWQASIHDNEVSPDSAKIEAHQGVESHERKLKIALAAALPSLKPGIGFTAIQAELAKKGIEIKKRKSGFVYALTGEKPIKASLIGVEVTRAGMKPFLDADLAPATAKTAPAIISGIKESLNSDGADWPLFHTQLAEHGITAVRNGGTSRAGGELIYTLSGGETLKGSEIGASLTEIESALGTTYRKAKKLRKTNSTAPAGIAQAEAPKAETLKTETVKTSEAVTDKDAAAVGVKKLYEQGRILSEENRKKIEALVALIIEIV